MSLQDSNRYADPVCIFCVLYYDFLHDDKEDCDIWQGQHQMAREAGDE